MKPLKTKSLGDMIGGNSEDRMLWCPKNYRYLLSHNVIETRLWNDVLTNIFLQCVHFLITVWCLSSSIYKNRDALGTDSVVFTIQNLRKGLWPDRVRKKLGQIRLKMARRRSFLNNIWWFLRYFFTNYILSHYFQPRLLGFCPDFWQILISGKIANIWSRLNAKKFALKIKHRKKYKNIYKISKNKCQALSLR